MNLENMAWLFGNIDDISKKLSLEFLSLDEKEFIEEKLDISDIFSEEDLIKKINEIQLNENKYYKIILIGNKHMEIDINKLIRNT